MYDAIVMGSSAGGVIALKTILPALDRDLPVPMFVVQHLDPNTDDYMVNQLNHQCAVDVRYAEDKVTPVPGTVYLAPANYHLMVEEDRVLALSSMPKVNFSRPSIDVLFETAAEAYLDRLIGVVLTGANSDGTAGLKKIKAFGGLVVVQSLDTAEAIVMPQSAITHVAVDVILPLNQIGPYLNSLTKKT